MMYKILFFGIPEIAVPSLEAIANMPDMKIEGVVVFPDKKIGRRQIPTPCPVKIKAQALRLPVIEITKKEDLENIYRNKKFDLGVVIAFGMIFPGDILKDKKFINVHFSLLPKYRGASPVQSAILNGEKISGITWQRMVKKLDAGDILFQKKLPLIFHGLEGAGQRQKTSQVFDFYAQETAKSFPQFLHYYCSGNLKEVIQDESQATYCQKIEKTEGEIFPKKETAEKIYRKYLAFNLWPGIYLKTKKGNVKITSAGLNPPEKKTEELSAFRLPCAQDTALYLLRAQIPGKKEMPVHEILKGAPDIFDF